MATAKPCLDCHKITTNGSRCPSCEQQHAAARERGRARPTRQERGLGADWQHIVNVAIAQHPYCARCGTSGSLDNPLTGDHITPRSAGGRNTRENCRVLCRRCNSKKGRGQG